MRAVALVAHHESLFEHELHQLQRGGISTVLTQRLMHLAHGAGALTPQHRQDGYFGVGWKRRGSGRFGKGSGGHASSVIRINSFVNEIIRITGDKPASALDERTINLAKRNMLDRSRTSSRRGLPSSRGMR